MRKIFVAQKLKNSILTQINEIKIKIRKEKFVILPNDYVMLSRSTSLKFDDAYWSLTQFFSASSQTN